jgi:hypothetical protein
MLLSLIQHIIMLMIDFNRATGGDKFPVLYFPSGAYEFTLNNY